MGGLRIGIVGNSEGPLDSGSEMQIIDRRIARDGVVQQRDGVSLGTSFSGVAAGWVIADLFVAPAKGGRLS